MKRLAALTLMSWALLYATLLTPSALGASDKLVVSISSLVVSIQAAQTASVQTRLTTLSRKSRLLAFGLVLAAAVAGGQRDVPTFAGLVLSVVAGACIGLVNGSRASLLLQAMGSASYQALILQRTVVLLLSAAIASAIDAASYPWAFATFVLGSSLSMVQFASREIQAEAQRDFGPSPLTALIGLTAGLFYRNDANWVRAAALGTADFELIHKFLVILAACQAAAGAVVVHLIFARRGIWISWLARNRCNVVRGLSASSVSCIVPLVAFLLNASALVVGILVILLALGTIIASALCHLKGWSLIPYGGGVVSVGFLLWLISSGVDPLTAMMLELGLLLAVLLVSSAIMMHRAESST